MATNSPIVHKVQPADLSFIRQSLQSNRQTKQTIRMLANAFSNQQLDFMNELQAIPQTSFDDDNDPSYSLSWANFEFLHDSWTFEKVQLAVCGPNSSGKTSFLQTFLKIGNILPTKVGPVSARIIKLTYASASDACLHVYKSIKAGLSREQPTTTIHLNKYFQDETKPDWSNLRETIAIHVERPKRESEESFTEWAEQFVELRIPSPILELGIDAYDTPGFLFYDKPVIKQNLHELVKLIRPTLIFMYENSTVAEDAYQCFLALKLALENLDKSHVFFLNTKQDTDVLFRDAGINQSQRDLLNPTKFNEILPGEREKRYKLLLNVPAMANELCHNDTTIDICDNFDISSLPKRLSSLPECANEMTETAIRRIIQFAVKNDLAESYYMADLILVTIDNFFEFSLTTSHREPSQWKKICADAREWGEAFFSRFERQLEVLIASIRINILRHLDLRSANISERAARLDRHNDPLETKTRQITKRSVKEFIKIAIQEEVIKVAVNEIIKKTRDTLQQLITHELTVNVDKNELLTAAQRQVLVDISATELQRRDWFERLILNITWIPTETSRLIKSLRTKWNVDFWNKRKSTEFKNEEEYYDYIDALDENENLIDVNKRKDFADAYVIKMKTTMKEQEKLFERNLKEWVETKKKVFFENIESNYRLAIKRLSGRKTAYEIVNLYAGPLAWIECRLLALKDLANFNGQLPIIDTSRTLGEGAFFTVHPAEWSEKKNLVVKKLKHALPEHPYLAYIEAHYHRKITKLAIPNIVPLLFLFDHSWNSHDCIANVQDGTDLWMFLPQYKQSLAEYLEKNISTIENDKIVDIALNISNVLLKLHSNEIVHRDVKSKNILLDNNDECYLADFGTCKASTINETIVGTIPLAPELFELQEYSFSVRHELASNYNGTAVDIYSFGILLYELLRKPQYHRPRTYKPDLNVKELLKRVSPLDSDSNDYEALIESCLEKSAEKRPTAREIFQKLQQIRYNIEHKLCLMCQLYPKKCRCYPCGHKVVCEDCYNGLPRHNGNKIQCILCSQIVDRWEEDNANQTFYLKV